MLKYKIFVSGKGITMLLNQWDTEQQDFIFESVEYCASCMNSWLVMGDLKSLPVGYNYVILPVFIIY